MVVTCYFNEGSSFESLTTESSPGKFPRFSPIFRINQPSSLTFTTQHKTTLLFSQRYFLNFFNHEWNRSPKILHLSYIPPDHERPCYGRHRHNIRPRQHRTLAVHHQKQHLSGHQAASAPRLRLNPKPHLAEINPGLVYWECFPRRWPDSDA